MPPTELVQFNCTRCGKHTEVRIPTDEPLPEEPYCDNCLVPFTCDICGNTHQTTIENKERNPSLTCKYCLSESRGTAGQRSSKSGICVICGNHADELVWYEDSPNEPVCHQCVPLADQITRELNSGILDGLFEGAVYLVGMVGYLLLSLGVAAFIVSTFELVWWMFFLLTGIMLFLGAHDSEIFEPVEVVNLAYATVAISISVWLVFGTENLDFTILLGGAVITGLIIHELAHKAVGLGFGNPARFGAFYTLNLVNIAVAYFTGLVFLTPGAVTNASYTERVTGIVAAAGPISNIILVFVFLQLASYSPTFGRIGVLVNAGLAAFNMIPIPPLDGSKVWRWNIPTYGLIMGVSLWLVYQAITTLL